MAEFRIDGRMTVRQLKENFKKEFEGTLRVYNGKELADDSATLASIRKNDDVKGGELVCRSSRTVRAFKQEMLDVFGLKVKVASPDDWVLALDGITLANLKNIKKNATRGDMEELIGYKRNKTDNAASVDTEEEDEDWDDEEEEMVWDDEEENEDYWNEDEDNEKEEIVDCDFDICNYDDAAYKFKYTSGNQPKAFVVDVDGYHYSEDNQYVVKFLVRDSPSAKGEYVSIAQTEFVTCKDVDDFGRVIAKHIIKDNDGEVRMSFYNENGMAEIENVLLTKELDYPLFDKDDMTHELTLSIVSREVMAYEFFELEDEFEEVKEMMEDEDTDGIWDLISYAPNRPTELFNLWGDDTHERLNARIEDENGKEILPNEEIVVGESNVFPYHREHYEFINEKYHPQYLLVQTDTYKRSYATFNVPKDFNIKNIHFTDANPMNRELGYLEESGDTITTISAFRYNGNDFFGEPGDNGTLGDVHYELYEWLDDEDRYELVCSC